MSSFSKLTYHLVYGTKFRCPSIKAEYREQLYKYIGGIIRSNQGCLIEIGGMSDHIHVLASLKPTVAISKIVQEIKGNSSKWINEEIQPESILNPSFEWQKGYSVFTVSYSGVRTVQQYIQNQQEHHRIRSFKEEYISLLKHHDIEFEDRYLFEGENHG